MNITISPTTKPVAKPDSKNLGFGKYFTDHMFLAHYSKEKFWHDLKIVPRQALAIDPAASSLHYAQALFEGMKAFKQKDGRAALFRPDFNWRRMQEGAERLCMVAPPEDIFIQGISELVKLDQDWIPSEDGASLYIRPTLIGTEGFLGVRPSEQYLFFVILSPVGSYYSEGLNPVKIWIEKDFLRAAPGGLGATKAAANYAGSLKAAALAKERGYSQVLWLDVNRSHIEEVGTMNVFFVLKNEILTPALDGTILGGGVRDSAIHLLRSWGHTLNERKISLQEIRAANESGDLLEVFGTGTAAVISPVGELASSEEKIIVNNNKMGTVAKKLYQSITDLQRGRVVDDLGWMRPL